MLLDTLRKRRSVRSFTNQIVEKEKIELLLEMALRSPSSRGLKPWQFVVVQDAEKLKALTTIKEHGGAFIDKAPLAIAIVADPEKCDVWIEDCSIASAIIHLGAEELGLGSCWVQVRKRADKEGVDAESNVARVLGLAPGLRVLSIVSIGYSAGSKDGHLKESLDYSVIHNDSFSV